MSIKTSQTILKCFLNLKSKVFQKQWRLFSPVFRGGRMKGQEVRDQSKFKLEGGGGGGEIVFYPKLFPDPYSIAPMFYRYPPSIMLKDLRAPVSYIT